MDRVRDVMTSQPVVVGSEASLVDCAVKMMDLGIRHLPVVDGTTVVGLVDDGGVFGAGVLVDGGALWFRFDAGGPEKAGDVAKPAVVVDVEDDLATALREMRGKGAAVVTEDGAVVGVLSEHDVVRVAPAILPASRTVDDASTTPVQTVRSSSSARDAIAKMKSLGIRHLVVADDGVALGVVSLRDLVSGWKGESAAVERYMGSKLSTVERGSSLKKAASRMSEEHIGCLPMLDKDGGAIRIVTRSDVLEAVATALEDEALFGMDG
ncbi:MAG: CBS domain-containing protein [Alphaproteobacteria bacterium]|nr:CBS domain-containing protein [Alphaproteobacteria bacterium]